MSKVKMNLPKYLVKTLEAYHKEGHIDLNSFVGNSVKKYIDSINSISEEQLMPINTHNTTNTKIYLSKDLNFKLTQLSKCSKVNKSVIVATALAFSLPVLIEEVTTLEEDVLSEVV